MRATLLSLLLCTCLGPLAAGAPKSAVVTKGPFDPARDAGKDLEAAKAEARRSGRRILLDVGGNWCPWCRKLDAFWEVQKDLKALRDKGFVFLMVNVSPENKNEAVLAAYPKVKGFPHLFVLDAQGRLLHSQDTGVLETGAEYSPEKLGDFLKAWKP